MTTPKPDGDQPRALSPRFTDAVAYAAELHARQWKKGTDIPYVAHLLGTCAIALEHGADEDAAIAALLHDAIEDQGGAAIEAKIQDRFGARVAAIVRGCSDSEGEPKPPWRERKAAYIAHLVTADRATLLVSASDKLDNARRILADLRAETAAGHADAATVWARFKGGREGQLWYLRELVTTFRANPAHEPRLVDELERTVTAIEAFA
jgi:GTP pyrophosphokinase